MATAFTDLVGCERPLQLAGMGGAGSSARLAAAVSNAGGLGMIGAGGTPVAFLEGMLDEMDALTSRPFGVNFLMPFLDQAAVTLASSRCRVVEFFYGPPHATLVEAAHAGGALVSWQVGSLDEARAAAGAGCDIVVAQGTEAGGHVRATKALDAILADVLGAVSVPVVAAGGIGTAERVKEVLDAGAAGVRVGTRFVASAESIAHPDYVEALVSSSAQDTEITQSFALGWPDAPHRVLSASLRAAEEATDDVLGSITIGTAELPVHRFSVMSPTKTTSGNIKAMCMYAGMSVDGVKRVQPASEIVAELCSLI